MANKINDNKNLMRNVQEACDELDRKEIRNTILQKQKEDAEYLADITTRANEELVKEIRDLNLKTGLYGVTKKEFDPRNEYENCKYIENNNYDHHHNHECYHNNQNNNECQCNNCNHIHNNQNNNECQCNNCNCNCNHIHNNQDVNVRVPFFREHKSMFLLIVGLVSVLLLATGFTPSGDFWSSIQDQWLTLIADVFKIILVVISSLLIYFGIKKEK